MNWSYSLNPLYPSFFRISEYFETPKFDFSRFYCTLEKQKGLGPTHSQSKGKPQVEPRWPDFEKVQNLGLRC